MELNKEHIDELIAKYLSGEASPDEAMMLEDWKDMSAENLVYFSESEKAFSGYSIAHSDMRLLYQRVLDEIEQTRPKHAKIVPLKRYLTPLRIAASLLIVSFLGLPVAYYFNNRNGQPGTMIASTDSTSQRQLADGSQVFLNKHTRLIVEEGFNGKQRKLKLEGEAFFEVVHNDEKPFVIEAGGVQIKDIGTAFNVKAEPQSDSVTVFVAEGIVDISNGDQTVQLLANQSVVYIRSTKTLHKVNNVQSNVASYKTKVFHFNAATLGEVVASLNNVYGSFIILEDAELAKCRITVEFNNESPETIIAIITETLGLRYEKRGDGRYEIKGVSCIQ